MVVLFGHCIVNTIGYLFCSASFTFDVHKCVKGMQLAIPGHHVPEIAEPHKYHLKHLCTLCSTLKGLGNDV